MQELANQRVPLCVPFWDQKEVLDLGAVFDKKLDCFTANAEYLDPFWNWLPLKWKKSPALVPEMIPPSSWQNNLRFVIEGRQWDVLRKECYKRAGFRCEMCGDAGKPHLEAHEVWEFDDDYCIQSLSGILCLCPPCHKGFHLGQAKKLGLEKATHDRIMFVNGWSRSQLSKALDIAHLIWQHRARFHWEVDLSWLESGPYSAIWRLDANRLFN